MILKCFNNNDYTRNLEILKKLKELVDGTSTFLIELEVKAKTQGQHSPKADTSTH